MMDTCPTHSSQRHQACDHCRRRKIKCSRGEPCERCYRLDLECGYSPLQALGRPRATRKVLLDKSGETPKLLVPKPRSYASPSSAPSCSLGQEISGSALFALSRSADAAEETGGIQNVQPQMCQCTSSVQQYFKTSAGQETEGGGSLAIARQAIDLARSILFCDACGNITLGPTKLAGNVLLLGAVFLDALEFYGSFVAETSHQRPTLEQQQVDVVDWCTSQDTGVCTLDSRTLTGDMKSDMEVFTSLCDSFAARQHKIHDIGHEACRANIPCQKPAAFPVTENPANICPKCINQEKFFSCLRTVSQIRTTIDALQMEIVN